MLVATEQSTTVLPAAPTEHPAPDRATDAQTFARLMRTVGLDASQLAQRAGDDPAAHRPRLVAAQLVSILFYAPLLAEMRKFSMGEKYASGGRTEEIFGEQLDRRIADAVAFSDRGGLTDILARQISGDGLNRPGPTPRAAREDAPHDG
ncbi:MAG: rod-binding protein [Planctomycetes bacterium]|nr:rod-binding protein [Planctomycetota bacterium]